ncbi:hypothetical protein TNCV_249661 [Trichonephila clavipes]|nr:hypothetical protein TNCV_249661 [Trichonephila clavipes]
MKLLHGFQHQWLIKNIFEAIVKKKSYGVRSTELAGNIIKGSSVSSGFDPTTQQRRPPIDVEAHPLSELDHGHTYGMGLYAVEVQNLSYPSVVAENQIYKFLG